MRLPLWSLLIATCAWGAGAPPCPTVSSISIDKGHYEARPGVVFLVENYAAHMVPGARQSPACFQKINEIERGHIVVSDAALSKMFEQKLSNSKKISGLKVEAKSDHVAISGTVHKGIPIHFSVEGPVDTDGHFILLHAKKIKADGLPVKGLLDMLGMELSGMLDPGANKGVTIQGDTISFDPAVVAHVRGHIERLQITGKDLVVDFGKPRATMAHATLPKQQK